MFVKDMLGMLVLALSVLGYCLWLKEKLSVQWEFTPIITFSGIGSVMFLAGILNVMPLCLVILLCMGLFQLRYLKSYKVYLADKRLLISFGIFAVFAGYLLLLLQGTMLTRYDNFSHWALVAKDILQHDRLPNFESGLIQFQSYPTGSASFIYFVCKLIGASEGRMVFAQALLLLSCIFTLGAFVKRKNLYMTAVIVGGGIYLLSSNMLLTELPVDTLLPLLGIAGAAIIYYYRQELEKAVVLVMPLMVFVIAIKNSGLYFLLVNWIFILYFAVKQHMWKKIRKRLVVLLAVVPLAVEYLWKQHVAYGFASGALAKHSMTVENYKAVLGGKSVGDMKQICGSMLDRVLTFQNEAVMLFLIMAVILTIGYFCRQRQSLKTAVEPKIAVLFFGTYAVYQVFLLGMYIFSMPLPEALKLASFTRYNQTINQFLYGIILLYLLIYVTPEVKKRVIHTVAVILMCILVVSPVSLHAEGVQTLWKKEDVTGTIRYQMEELRQEYGILPGKKYFVYISDMHYTPGYCRYMVRYMLESSEVVVCNRKNVREVWNTLEEEPDYYIICKEDKKIRKLLKQKGFQTGVPVITPVSE